MNQPVPATPPSLPAVLFADPATAALRVVALPLLDRLIVAAHRAGCAPITVVSPGPLPRCPRTLALGIPVHSLPAAPALDGPALVANTRQLVQAADLREVIERRGRLRAADGTLLPAGVVNAPPHPNLETALASLPPVPARGVACPVTDAASARRAGEALWRSLTSSSDGFVDVHVNRPLGRRLLSRWLVHTPITPNQVSLAAIALGLLAGVLFGSGNPTSAVIAAVIFQVSAVVDCVDGDLARAVFKESPLGKWLDLVGDQVVHAAVFAGIAIGLWRTQPEGPFLALGAAAVLGAVIAFPVVLRGMRHPGAGGRRLQQLIDRATNRDFSVLVLALAVAGRLDAFLWLAAVGSHGFWITALALQLTQPRPPATPSRR